MEMEMVNLDAEPPRSPISPTYAQDHGGEKVDKNSFKYRLRNQLISGFSFLPNIKCSIIFSLVLGIILLGLGTAVLLISNSVVEVEKRYDDVCGINQPDCKVKIQIPSKMEKPVFFYLQVQNFYQNHRLYVKSYSPAQLRGENVAIEDLDKCKPVLKNSDLPASMTAGKPLYAEGPANPCGLIAKSFIDDGFTLYDPADDLVDIRTTDIAWSVDKEKKFKRNDNYLTTQYRNVEDERFMNWMSFSTLYYWKKLWGVIDQDLPAGEYEFKIYNKFDVLPFEGEKHILLSNVSVLGGTSVLLATLFLIMGGLYVALALMIGIYAFVRKNVNDQNYSNIDFTWD